MVGIGILINNTFSIENGSKISSFEACLDYIFSIHYLIYIQERSIFD